MTISSYSTSLYDEADDNVDRRKCTPFDRDDLQTSIIQWNRRENTVEDRLLKWTLESLRLLTRLVNPTRWNLI